MKTIKFRIVKNKKDILIQEKILWFWRYFLEFNASIAGVVSYPKKFKSKKAAIKKLYDDQLEKPEHLKLIQYPTIKIL
jgi:hypothetical protein